MNDPKRRQRHQQQQELPQLSTVSSPPRETTFPLSPQHANHLLIPSSPLPLTDADTKGHGSIDSYQHQHHLHQFSLVLTLSGMCCALLSTVFGLFHIDVFLRVYQLPLHAFSTGSVVFSIINTANDLLGAWLLDVAATKIDRSDLIGVSGVLFSLCFLAPFFRWKDPSPDGYYYDEAHFIISISMYDTLFSFTTILLGSLVTDNHRLSDKERVNVLASGKVLNLVSTFVVAKIGLGIFDTDDMGQFRVFLLILAALVAVLFVVSQALTHYSIFIRWNSMRVHFLEMKKEKGPSTKTTEKLKVKQVFQDFWRHNNFWAWIWMELLLESQNSFSNAFLKTFVDRLLHDEGMSRENCDWLLSASGPLGLVLGIFCYIPIRKMGYKQVYPALFLFNFFLSLAMVLGANHQSSYAITVFLVIYPAITSAVASTGFHLAMSDMVLEMKKTHALDGRFDEPSLAGLFIGVNALFCKPAESMLPVIAANRLENFSLTAEDDENVQKVLFKLLVMPPLLFSCIQYLSWRRYSLTPAKTSQMRDNLRHLEHEISQRSLENGDELLPTHTTNPND